MNGHGIKFEALNKMELTAKGHTLHAVRALLNAGWKVEAAPTKGKLDRNGQLVKLLWEKKERAFRLFIYKITGSGRNEHERRVEITTTYEKGLSRVAGYEDIVLGYDPTLHVFVGVDARRVEHGGKTGNASSFIDAEGLARATDRDLVVLRRQSQLFGVERHAYFGPSRLSEYLLNAGDIHRGVYGGTGDFSMNRSVTTRSQLSVPERLCGGSELVLRGPTSLRVRAESRPEALQALEEGNSTELSRLRITQSELVHLTARLQEIGLKGEEIALRAELRRLRRAGRADLAAKVSWVSQSSPFEGYDILSFETDGTRRFIEVKATVGTSKTFPMTANEWRVASLKEDAYFIYRLTTVDSRPKTRALRNPLSLEKQGKLKRHELVSMVTYE